MGERFFPDEMPEPAASAETVGWWDACARHELVVQRCTACGHTRHPPGPLCPACRADGAQWAQLSGSGSVYSFTVVHQAFIAALADRVPYVVAAVELDGGGGTRMVSNVVGIDPHDVEIGMAVDVVWEDMGPELALPRFRPVAPASGAGAVDEAVAP
ncbi:MAG: Zn-ribbon domain-containing OB-fold protein [Acidimicrobiales bacterium]